MYGPFTTTPNFMELAVHTAVANFRFYPPTLKAAPPAPPPKVQVKCLMKACNTCGIVKPETDFHMLDGAKRRRRLTCKACLKERVKLAEQKAKEKGLKLEALSPTKPVPAECLPAGPRYEFGIECRRDRPDGLLRSRTDLDRHGIVHRGPVSPAISGYLKVAA